MKRKLIRLFLIALPFMIGVIALLAEATNVHYHISENELVRSEKKDEGFVKTVYCKDKIHIEDLGLSRELIEQDDDVSVSVSQNEKYLVIRGTANKNSPFQYFIIDIPQCIILRELSLDKRYDVINQSALFSPDSKSLYISWFITLNDGDTRSSAFWFTKEYSGDSFANDRVLKNVVVPTLPHVKGKLSRDGRYLLQVATPKNISNGTVYLGWVIHDLREDKEVFRMGKWEDYFGKRKLMKGEVPPDISDGLLLFNFAIETGVEVVIFDYNKKKIRNIIDVPKKGLGAFSLKGNYIFITKFQGPHATQKDILVYMTETGNRIGQATIDVSSEAIDLSSDGKHIILNNNKMVLIGTI